MSRSARVTRFFGDGDYTFALEIAQLEELQEKTDVGLGDNLERIERVFVTDIQQVLRLGLIGGSIDTGLINGRPAKEEAFRLVVRHCVAGEIGVCAAIAATVCSRAIAGVKDEPLGEGAAGEQNEVLSRDEKSGSQPSTEPERRSAIRPKKSVDAASGTSEPRSRAGRKPTVRKTPSNPRPLSNTTQT